jgi:hypothetical protein
VNFWVELHNPFRRDPNLPDAVSPKDTTLWSAARLRMPQGSNAKTAPPYGVYQLLITKAPDPSLALQQPGNTLGNPPFPSAAPPGTSAQPGQVVRAISDFTSTNAATQSMTDVVRASDPAQYAGTPGQNVNGFYVLGPNYTPGFPGAQQPFETLKVQESVIGSLTNSMTYKLPAGAPGPILTGAQLKQLPPYGLLLQRLACPQLPPNPPAGSPPGTPPNPSTPYNPYITIDYVDSVQAYVMMESNSPATKQAGIPHLPLRSGSAGVAYNHMLPTSTSKWPSDPICKTSPKRRISLRTPSSAITAKPIRSPETRKRFLIPLIG